ncbi:hypothetical protein [Cytophaga aurantiaca]|uniref:hypothetical protein n=1 Tax=Cytophaga aurantiaca TaxID=29530 RepID=UPI000379CC9C|nr:hypothetical protein [Cytophaga aurantiaca]
MERIKHTLFSDWHFMRWLRLIIGIVISIHAFQSRDILSGLLAAFLLFQAVLNTGCCRSNGCDLPYVKKKNNT